MVNLLDGKRLGFASDLEIDAESGKITAIVVPGPGKFLWIFGKSTDFVIPWERIRKIGVDVVLVETSDYVDDKSVVINFSRNGDTRLKKDHQDS